MYDMFVTGKIDLALIVTNLFVLAFFILVLYLRREDRREGYPLEDDVNGRLESTGGLTWTARPKTFKLAFRDHGKTVPNGIRDPAVVNARRSSRAPGSPLLPNGDPLLAGVGPGSYAQRARTPDILSHGDPKIVPMRLAKGFFVDKKDANPVGMTVLGADGVAAGVVSELWVDQAEYLIRYLEIELKGSGRHVLAPMTMVRIRKGRKTIEVQSLLAAQFETVPTLESPDLITLDEEERVAAYYGGGTLYATPSRQEPWL
jgi:photosynthetic reaction center H subunit